MSVEVRFATAFTLFLGALLAAVVYFDSSLPGRIQDLPANELEIVNKLQSVGYDVRTEGFS